MVHAVDDWLKKTFPFGLDVIPRNEGDLSYVGVVGDEYEPQDDIFRVWEGPYRNREFSRELEETSEGGWVANDIDGNQFFLRPLPQEKAVTF